MDTTDDEDLRKKVIDQMMGETDDMTADSLKRKPDAPVKGVEISITVSPKTEEEIAEKTEGEEEPSEKPEGVEGEDEDEDEGTEGSYISQLLKKLG